MFNATFNNISVISWRSVLLLEETGVHGENYCPVASHGFLLPLWYLQTFFTDQLYHIMRYRACQPEVCIRSSNNTYMSQCNVEYMVIPIPNLT